MALRGQCEKFRVWQLKGVIRLKCVIQQKFVFVWGFGVFRFWGLCGLVVLEYFGSFGVFVAKSAFLGFLIFQGKMPYKVKISGLPPDPTFHSEPPFHPKLLLLKKALRAHLVLLVALLALSLVTRTRSQNLR